MEGSNRLGDARLAIEGQRFARGISMGRDRSFAPSLFVTVVSRGGESTFPSK